MLNANGSCMSIRLVLNLNIDFVARGVFELVSNASSLIAVGGSYLLILGRVCRVGSQHLVVFKCKP